MATLLCFVITVLTLHTSVTSSTSHPELLKLCYSSVHDSLYNEFGVGKKGAENKVLLKCCDWEYKNSPLCLPKTDFCINDTAQQRLSKMGLVSFTQNKALKYIFYKPERKQTLSLYRLELF